jgi:flagellar basal-body rod protein FlgB
MISTDGLRGRNFAVASAALDGLAMRQQLHAENLANVDTEGYHAKTVDFERVLGAAMKGEDPGNMYYSQFSAAGDAVAGSAISGKFGVERSHKEGVDRTTEVSEMMNDNVRFRVLSQQVTNQISAVRSVIAEMGRG